LQNNITVNTIRCCAGFEVLNAVIITSIIFRVITPYSSGEIHRRFGRTYGINPQDRRITQGDTIKKKAVDLYKLYDVTAQNILLFMNINAGERGLTISLIC
jgi:hypothetical protein